MGLGLEEEGQELESDLDGGATVTFEVSKQTDDPTPQPLVALLKALPTATQG